MTLDSQSIEHPIVSKNCLMDARKTETFERISGFAVQNQFIKYIVCIVDCSSWFLIVQ